MAPFTRRQIGYVQAIAGRQQHRTFKVVNDNRVISSTDAVDVVNQPQALASNDSSLLLFSWHLHEIPNCWDSRGIHNDDVLTGADFDNLSLCHYGGGPSYQLRCLDVPMHPLNDDGSADDPSVIPSTHRATPDGYLESTHMKIRWTLPTDIQKYASSTTFVKPDASKLDHMLPHILTIDSNNQYNNMDTSKWQQVIDQMWNNTLTNTSLSTILGGTAAQAMQMMPQIQDIYNSIVKFVNPTFGGQSPLGQPHYEFRFIVFRNKLPTYRNAVDSNNLEALRNGVSFLNPTYDLFMGQSGRPRGLVGYRHHAKFDQDKDIANAGSARYSGKFWDGTAWQDGGASALYPSGEERLTVADLMTLPLNTNDYVVMKDVRFFLGQSQGKSHFEDTLHFDWNDAIDSEVQDLLASPTLAGKNYRWQMMLLGTSNGHEPVVLKSEIRTTTTCRSG